EWRESRSATRDELLEVFWPGGDPRLTRPRLRQAVRDARRLLGTAIVGENECYWLDRATVDVDLDELERLLAEARTAELEYAHALSERALRRAPRRLRLRLERERSTETARGLRQPARAGRSQPAR